MSSAFLTCDVADSNLFLCNKKPPAEPMDFYWQGFSDLFQTFKGLDDVMYIDEDIIAVEDLMIDSEDES